MRIGFDKADFNALADLWKRVAPSRYGVDSGLIRQNTVGCRQFDWGASLIQLDGDKLVGFLSVKKSAYGAYKGPDEQTAHVGALIFEDPLVGVDLMAYAKKILRNRGIDKLKFGQDLLHFFSGCPTDWPQLRDFLIVEGFEEVNEQVDLERDLGDYEPLHDALAPLECHPGSPGEREPCVRTLVPDDIPALDKFLGMTFPGRWRHDARLKIEQEGSPGGVYGLFIDGAIEGFAVTQFETDAFPMSGAVWKNDLGPSWCSLGPIGVSTRVRGKGFGEAVLAGALLGLRMKGGRRCIIDWTTLDEFYGRQGFEVTRRYSAMTLSL